MRPPVGRIENRPPLVVAVKLSSTDTGTFEFATTENVSLHGACVKARKSWLPDERVSVISLEGNLISQGRVVYCGRIIRGRLGTVCPNRPLDISHLAVAANGPSGWKAFLFDFASANKSCASREDRNSRFVV